MTPNTTNTEPEKKSSFRFTIILLIVLAIAFSGSYLYYKGENDAKEKVRIEQRITYIRDLVPHKQAELQMAYSKLDHINGFQFLRTPQEKEQQLAQQNKIINEISENLNTLKNELAVLETKK